MRLALQVVQQPVRDLRCVLRGFILEYLEQVLDD